MSKIAVRLAQMDFIRYRPAMPGWSIRGILLSITYIVVLLFGSLFMFRNLTDPTLLFVSGALVLITFSMYIAMFDTILMASRPFHLWWLTLPHPRLTLVHSKVLTFSKAIWRMSVVLLIVLTVHYTIAVYTGRFDAMSWIDTAAIMSSLLLFSVTALPLVILLGMTVSLMYGGWMRWVTIIPYTIIMMLPFTTIPILVESAPSSTLYLTPTYILLYALGMVAIGWPIAYLLMRCVAWSGMHNLVNIESQMKFGSNSKLITTGRGQIPELKGGFTALYHLERSFFRHLGSRLPIKVIVSFFLILIAVGSFFAVGSESEDAMKNIPSFILLIPFFLTLIWEMNANNYAMMKNRLHWWLNFPYSRRLLAFAHIAAVWVSAVRYMLVLLLSFWVGAGIGLAADPADTDFVHTSLLWSVYAVLIYVPGLAITLGLLQVGHYLMKHTVLAIVFFPIYIFIPLQPLHILKYLYPDHLLSPDWPLLRMCIGIGIPLAILCFILGSKHLHAIIRHDLSPRWKKSRGL
jgi:hypothetical protein